MSSDSAEFMRKIQSVAEQHRCRKAHAMAIAWMTLPSIEWSASLTGGLFRNLNRSPWSPLPALTSSAVLGRDIIPGDLRDELVVHRELLGLRGELLARDAAGEGVQGLDEVDALAPLPKAPEDRSGGGRGGYIW